MSLTKLGVSNKDQKKAAMVKESQSKFSIPLNEVVYIPFCTFTVLTSCGGSLLAEEKPKVFGNPGT